jgi:Zn-dependent protease
VLTAIEGDGYRLRARYPECSSLWAAVKMGDTLPLEQGRYTLNPRRHLDVIGTLLLALVGFGWAKPVQFNPYALRKAPNMRAGIFVVASAGPLMNVLLAVLAALPFRLGLVSVRDVILSQPLAVICTLLSSNLVLAVFNIPCRPDGSKILAMLPAV